MLNAQGRWARVGVIALLLVLLVLGVYGIYVGQFLWRSLPVRQATVIEIVPGTSVRGIATQLTAVAVINSPAPFVLANLPPFARKPLQAGEYFIQPGMSGNHLLYMLRTGQVVKHRLTIVEGWTFAQLVQAINANPYIQKTLDYNHPETILPALGRYASSPEGCFYPDTYVFSKGTTDKVILGQALKRMERFWDVAWPSRDLGLPYQTPYDAMKAASLVEKESAYLPERPLIAGVIVLRLQANMPLQMDPSVIYGLGNNYRGNLTSNDMRLDTPYNNYLHRGLPPTPIAFPSASSMLAVVHPRIIGFLYFVAKGDGSHVFSKTLMEQDKAIKQYQLTPKKNQTTTQTPDNTRVSS